ncbi:fungal-specific transcription factor domain-containing protein [Fusarium venenatum]|nr:fungal-specific transcription factor domain-containing protein [Fusarium venenatum]
MEQSSAKAGWHSRCVKSRSGCVTCKKRRLKCDETEPLCKRCIKSGLACPGYNKPIKWSTKYEIHDGSLGPSDHNSLVSGSSSQQDAVLDGTMPPTLYHPQDEFSSLLTHYYSNICQVVSSFDSPQNPYRSLVSTMMLDSPIIFNCVMTISASHLSQLDSSGTAPIVFQTEAISHISKDIAEIDTGSSVCIQYNEKEFRDHIQVLNTPTVKDELLIGIILLGMTSSWYDPSSLGLFHFHGARRLFTIWMTEKDLTQLQLPSSCTQRLIVSSMVYWEVMAACLVDQGLEDLAYLDVFRTQPRVFFSYPCPWTGVGMEVLILLAKCVALVRNVRSAHRTVCVVGSLSKDFAIINQASILIREINDIQITSIAEIQETGDLSTPADHLYKMAQCHRLVALLELHRTIPELIYGDIQDEHDHQHQHSQQVLALAIEVLEISGKIPQESHTIAIQTLMLLSVGSTLSFYSTTDPETILMWRNFVMGRLCKLFHTFKLQTINRAATILKEVWSQMDSMVVESASCCSPIMHIHWVDVMVDKKLDTILG